MIVKALVDIPSKKGTITAGKVFTIPDAIIDRIKGKVEVIPSGEPVASCKITGDECHIEYAPTLYQKYRHRDGEQIDVEGVLLTLRIKEINQ